MNYVYYVKVWFGFCGNIKTCELFTLANNYAEVGAQMEESFKEDLLSYQAYGFDADLVYVEDIPDFLAEARETFKEG